MSAETCELSLSHLDIIRGSMFKTRCGGNNIPFDFVEHPKTCHRCKKPFVIPPDGMPLGYMDGLRELGYRAPREAVA